MSLLSEERKILLLEELDSFGKIKVSDVAKRFQVSNETIRRDLEVLEEENKLKRVYGGAVKASYSEGEPAFQQRKVFNDDEKEKIGRTAADFIKDGDAIFLDVGTTTMKVASMIRNRKNIIIVTNSLSVANVLQESLHQGLFSGQVIILGGELSSRQLSLTGPITESILTDTYIDKAFLSVGGISLQAGITDYDVNEVAISRLAVKNAKEVIVLADYSKIGVQAFTKVANFDDIDVIVCDNKPPATWENILVEKNVDWIETK